MDPVQHRHQGSRAQHIRAKLLKSEDKEIVEVVRGKVMVTFKGGTRILKVDISTEAMGARRQQNDAFKMLEGGNRSPGYIQRKCPSQVKAKQTHFHHEQKLRDFVASKYTQKEKKFKKNF